MIRSNVIIVVFAKVKIKIENTTDRLYNFKNDTIGV